MEFRALPVKLGVALLLVVSAAYAGSGVNYSDLYRRGAVVFKVAPELKVDLPREGATRFGRAEIDRFMDDIGAQRVERMFPVCQEPRPGGVDLTRIYVIYFPESLQVKDIARDLGKLSGIEYAEPMWYAVMFLDHNDPYRNRQYGLDLCQANDAHDISTGDPDAVVGIIDSGVDQDHPDLVGNRWVNPGEDLDGDGRIDNDERNGEDDDDNGYVDDFYGWDFVGNNGRGDNDPDDTYGHGTHVAGIASAVTNNNVGIASVGYSCSIMGVRTGDQGVIQYGYQGIRYAVDNGAGVLNCSWGSGQFYAAGRDVVDYATEHGCLVVASAGNDGNAQRIYPGAYDNSVGVAATDNRDRKAGFSTYGDWVDISAPGADIYSTLHRDRYAYMSGTSMSSPFTASVAILIRAAFPDLSVEETRQLLLEGADDIDDENPNYRGELGAGRINAYQSLLLGNRPALEIEELDIAFDENDNHRLDPGERADFVVTITNNHESVAAEDVVVRISTDDEELVLHNNEVQFPDIEPEESVSNDDDPFTIEVGDDAIPHTTWLTVSLSAEPGGVNLEHTFEIVVGHPDILVVDDDDGDELEDYYLSSIGLIGQGWVRWDVNRDLAPEPRLLTDHPMVIWFTGNSDPALDDLDRWQLETALSEGANIMLIGRAIGDDSNNLQLLARYFGAVHEEDSVRAYQVTGLGGNRPLAASDTMMLFGGGGAQNGLTSPSTMSLVNDGDSLGLYLDQRGETAGLAGIYRVDPRTESRTVYLGFSFEAVSGMGGTTPRQRVLQELYDWFTGDLQSAPLEETVPQVFLLEPAYPNPFNGRVELRYSLPVSSRYTLSIVDQTGRQVTLLTSGTGAAGMHLTAWDAGAAPSGIYFAKLDATGRAPLLRRVVLVR